jgi:hypothetical protein
MEVTTKSPDPPTSQLVTASLRIEQDVLDVLRLDAQEHGRTVSQSIRYHVRRSLEMAAA